MPCLREENRLPPVSLTIQLKSSAQQKAFNLKRWAELLADPEVAGLALACLGECQWINQPRAFASSRDSNSLLRLTTSIRTAAI